MSRYSQSRLEARIREAVSMMIVRGEIKHPDLSTLSSVSRIALSADNAYATLFITCPIEGDLEKSVSALQSAHGFIQKKLGMFLRTKNTPVLTFKADTAFLEGEKVNQLIDSLGIVDGK